MDSPTLLRQLLRLPQASRYIFTAPTRPHSHHNIALLARQSVLAPHARHLSIPRVITPSFWVSLLPHALRRNPLSASAASDAPRRQRNPATSYIILSLLVGSQAIQSIWLKRDQDHYTRRAESQIGVLREVIERVRNGEEVDVEGVLGTGVEEREREWQEVMEEVEGEEVLFRSKKERKALREMERDGEGASGKKEGMQEAEESGSVEQPTEEVRENKVKAESYKGARFY